MELPAEQPADHSEIEAESDRKTKKEEQWRSQVPDNTRPCALVCPTLATLLRSACMMKLCNTYVMQQKYLPYRYSMHCDSYQLNVRHVFSSHYHCVERDTVVLELSRMQKMQDKHR